MLCVYYQQQKVESAELWVDEIQASVDDANMEAKHGLERESRF